MSTYTVARGGGGGSRCMLSREFFDKNGVIWSNLSVPKYVITKLKINNFKGKNQHENLIDIFLSQTNLD